MQDKWSWMMEWCRKNGLPPGDSRIWEIAEKEYHKNIEDKTP